MKSLKETIKKIHKEDKGLLAFMIITLVLSVFLFSYSVLSLKLDGAVLKVGYDDISRGYRNGSWGEMLVYPVAAFLFGVLHNLVAVRLFDKKGGGTARLFLGVTVALIIGTFVLMFRLNGGN